MGIRTIRVSRFYDAIISIIKCFRFVFDRRLLKNCELQINGERVVIWRRTAFPSGDNNAFYDHTRATSFVDAERKRTNPSNKIIIALYILSNWQPCRTSKQPYYLHELKKKIQIFPSHLTKRALRGSDQNSETVRTVFRNR